MNDEFRQRRHLPGRQPSGSAAGSGTGSLGGPSGAPDDFVDVGQVHFDDAFLDALSRDIPTPTRDDNEYQLAELLSSWRYEVRAEPTPPLPSIAEVERAMAAQTRTRRGARAMRSLRVVAGAAAIALVAAAGLTVVSEGASPGDSLWSVKKVVFAQAASETQAAYDVRSDLERAEAALAAGDTVSAQRLIAGAQSKLGPVRDSDTRDQMNEWISRLRAEEAKDPGRSNIPQRAGVPIPGSEADSGSSAAPETSDETTAPSGTTSPKPTPPSSSVPSSTAAASTSTTPAAPS